MFVPLNIRKKNILRGSMSYSGHPVIYAILVNIR